MECLYPSIDYGTNIVPWTLDLDVYIQKPKHMMESTQGCEWEFQKRAEIVLKTHKIPENSRKGTFVVISTTKKELKSAFQQQKKS